MNSWSFIPNLPDHSTKVDFVLAFDERKKIFRGFYVVNEQVFVSYNMIDSQVCDQFTALAVERWRLR